NDERSAQHDVRRSSLILHRFLVLDSRPLFQSRIFHNCGKAVDSQRHTPGPLMNVWKQVLSSVEQLIDRSEYESWFAPTRFLAQKGDTIDVSVPSQRYVDEIRERYGQQIRQVLSDISPDRVQI